MEDDEPYFFFKHDSKSFERTYFDLQRAHQMKQCVKVAVKNDGKQNFILFVEGSEDLFAMKVEKQEKKAQSNVGKKVMKYVSSNKVIS